MPKPQQSSQTRALALFYWAVSRQPFIKEFARNRQLVVDPNSPNGITDTHIRIKALTYDDLNEAVLGTRTPKNYKWVLDKHVTLDEAKNALRAYELPADLTDLDALATLSLKMEKIFASLPQQGLVKCLIITPEFKGYTERARELLSMRSDEFA